LLGLIAYGVYYLFVSGNSPNHQPSVTAPPRMVLNAPKTASPPIQKPATVTAPSSSTAGNGALSIENKPAEAVTAPTAGEDEQGAAQLVLRARQATHVLVQDESGKVYTNRVLQPGETYPVPNVSGLSLTAEHGNAVEIDVNGKPAGLAGQTADAAVALPLDAGKFGGQHPTGAPPQ